jgi:hypothetical protein
MLAMVASCVLFEVRTVLLNIIYTCVGFKGLNYLLSEMHAAYVFAMRDGVTTKTQNCFISADDDGAGGGGDGKSQAIGLFDKDPV